MKPTAKPSILLAWAGWISVFVESWLLLLRRIPADGLSWAFFGLFFVIAVMASAVNSGKSKERMLVSDIRVRIGERVFSEEEKNLTVLQNGHIALCVIKLEDLKLK